MKHFERNFMKMKFSKALSFLTLMVTLYFWPTFAHEKSFPSKQLSALTPEGMSVTFKEISIRPNPEKLSEFEKQHTLTFSKGELAGNLFVGSSDDKKSQIVVVFLDGKSDRGDTEFGAAINTKGRIAKVSVFSSSEPSASKEFLESLYHKDASELKQMMSLFEKEPSKQFLIKLSLKAIGRVSSSFK
jgi:hypothetical protein